MSRRAGFACGIPPEIATSGFVPTSIHTSLSSKAWVPASQWPCAAAATCLPGWSIVPLLKRSRSRSAFMKAVAIAAVWGS
ncbi:MAG: hypothetical protein R3E53_17235 [Myxococcota bacterium]